MRGAIHGGVQRALANWMLGLTFMRTTGGGMAVTVSLYCDPVGSLLPGGMIECSAEITRVAFSAIFVQGELRCGKGCC